MVVSRPQLSNMHWFNVTERGLDVFDLVNSDADYHAPMSSVIEAADINWCTLHRWPTARLFVGGAYAMAMFQVPWKIVFALYQTQIPTWYTSAREQSI